MIKINILIYIFYVHSTSGSTDSNRFDYHNLLTLDERVVLIRGVKWMNFPPILVATAEGLNSHCIITMTSNDHKDIFIHSPLHCFFISLSVWHQSKHGSFESLGFCEANPLVIGGLHKEAGMREAFTNHDIIIWGSSTEWLMKSLNWILDPLQCCDNNIVTLTLIHDFTY